MLEFRAQADPLRPLFFDMERDSSDALTAPALLARVRKIAGYLRSRFAEGDRLLIACHDGLTPIIAFFAAVEAGCIAVPVPTSGGRQDGARLTSIIADCQPRAMLLANHKPVVGEGQSLEIVDIAAEAVANGDTWTQEPGRDPSTLAVLQYTSGSIGEPKGVRLSHRNLLSNLAAIEREFGLTSNETAVLWLPLFHDMGLIGGLLQAVFTGYPLHRMSAARFTRAPMSWLQAISSLKATVSGGPNIAYELCARAASQTAVRNLDLSTWKVAFNGAEPVRASTLENFARAFAPCGFRASSLIPCYGLAEATLLVACPKRGTNPRVMTTSQGGTLVSMGRPIPEASILIVDPHTGCRLAPGETGEVCISGPAITSGYWSGENTGLLGATQDVGDGRFLRTGDLGRLVDEELYITGRIKDLIIIHGTNHHAEDIEGAISNCHTKLKLDTAVAFATGEGDEEKLTVLQEVPAAVRNEELDAITDAIRRRLLNDFGLVPDTIAYARRNRVPRTSSGKKRRQACRDLYLSGQLDLIRKDSAQVDAIPGAGSCTATELVERFCERRLGLAAAEWNNDATLPELGLDSMAAMELRSLFKMQLGLELPLERIADTPIRRLSEHAYAVITGLEDTQDIQQGELSSGQKALWFLGRMNPESDAYTITRLLRIEGPLDEAVLVACFHELGQRHDLVRGFVDDRGRDPMMRFAQQLDVEAIDMTSTAAGRIEQLIEEFRKPAGAGAPLVVIRVFRHSPVSSTLLINAHHMAVDLHSLLSMFEEVVAAYAARRRNAQHHLAPPRQFSAFVSAEAQLLASPRAEQLRLYWKATLADALEPLQLFAAGNERTGASGNKHFQVQPEVFGRVVKLARKWGLTPHALILTVYGILLRRYSGQQRFPLGIVASGRTESRFLEVVGYFVNLLPIPMSFSTSATFMSAAEMVSRAVTDALAHQDLPYSQIVDAVRVASQQQPLITAVCMWQSSTKMDRDVAGFVSGQAGSIWRCEELVLRSLSCEPRNGQFDLILTCVEDQQKLSCVLSYDRGCFTSEMIDVLAENLGALIEIFVEHPDQPLDSIATPVTELSNEAVQRQNATSKDVPDNLIHRQFESIASQFPHRVAVSHRSSSITYAGLQQRVNQVAHYLRGLGVKPESRVGIMAERSIPMIIGILGILTAGAAYVPLDPMSPPDRLRMIVSEADASIVLASKNFSARFAANPDLNVVLLEGDAITSADTQPIDDGALPGNLAYVMFTSGSTGKPKGVMVEHRNVVNFFAGMDEKVGCGPSDCLLALTSIGFDISVLELLWTLARGAEVVLADEVFSAPITVRPRKTVVPEVSLFYFADSAAQRPEERYRLLIEGAKLADAEGFAAIWTPERHFHSFGGLYPNPAITAAALSTITRRVQIRGGSVVMPLHNPIRVAEDWAVIDNLSGGRAGIAVASGWHTDDFVLNPANYQDRKQIALAGIDTVRRLWRGETIRAVGGNGNFASVGIHPLPVQAQIPIWLTSSGSRETFASAAAIEANLLTHLLGQQLPDLQEKIKTYHSLSNARDSPVVTLMLHTYIDESWAKVQDATLKPFKEYLKSSVDLMGTFVQSAGLDLDLQAMSEKDRDALASFAAEKYMQEGGLFGSSEQGCERLVFLAEMGVTEVACLIDFGIDRDLVLKSLRRVASMSERLVAQSPAQKKGEGGTERSVTMLQCTPTLMRSALSDAGFRKMLGGLRILLLGGEPVPPSVVEQARQCGVPRIFNMYGPTETTIWSMACEIEPGVEKSLIRGPIVNTKVYIVDDAVQALPIGVVGEIAIGGAGVARGYIADPVKTAQRFVPDPFAVQAGSRLYRTGDLGRRLSSGAIEILGRSDQQVKIRGYRIELGEIEAALSGIPDIEAAVVVPDAKAEDLAAYVVIGNGVSLSTAAIERSLRGRLPAYMIPREIRFLAKLPVNSSGKVDRAAVCRSLAEGQSRTPKRIDPVTPADAVQVKSIEDTVSAIWREVLKKNDFTPDSNFFDVGGHSLMMAQVHQRLQTAVNREFPLGSLLEAPTVRAMSRMLAAQNATETVLIAAQAKDQHGALRALRQHAAAARQAY